MKFIHNHYRLRCHHFHLHLLPPQILLQGPWLFLQLNQEFPQVLQLVLQRFLDQYQKHTVKNQPP